MSNEGRARENGYRAFISYSHRDDVAAKSLHKRLETYRLPKKLIGLPSERGPIPERLTPIFRDLDELSAADDLTVEIKAALARSATLIVLCSPGAKASKWVNLEIETFRALHGNTRPVLAALIEGEPADAFPPALIANGQEPVAADFRKNRDGKSLALLKLVAGMAGAPLDALVQRDAQRQYRRVMAITGGALTAALAMALLLVVALRAQSEAERQRQEAEGLVEYMITDLRDKLNEVGRLDVMTAVNERAMKYYGNQPNLDEIPPESAERRARILHAMGDVDQKRKDTASASKKFETAYAITEALLADQPNNAERAFAHSVSEYWIGQMAYDRQDFTNAKVHFMKNRSLAKKASSITPSELKFTSELGHAETNLCALAMTVEPLDLDNAMKFCFDAVSTKRKIVAINPKKNEYLFDLANSLAWLAALQQNNKKFDFAIKLLEEQLSLSENIVLNDSKNAMGQYMLSVSKTALAEAIISKNGIKDDKSLELLNSSIEILDKIDSIDVSDSSRRSLRTRIIILKTK